MNETGIFQRANGNNEDERVLSCIQLGKVEYKPLEENVMVREIEAESQGILAHNTCNALCDIT